MNYREDRIKRNRIISESIEVRNKISEKIKILWKDVNYIDKMNDPELKSKMSAFRTGNKYRAKFVYKIKSPNGEIFEIDDMKRFCKDRELNQGNMSEVANGKMQSYKGWIVISKIIKESINN